MPVLGAHVDSSGGLHLAFERAKAMGADAIQIHPTPPGFWGSPKLDENRIATFKEAAAKHGHPPFYFHAVYLINLAGDDPTMRQRSESTLAGYLKAADDLGVDGVIFHTGSHKGAGFEARLPSITEHLQHVLERASPKSARLLIENNAGLGGMVGAKFEEIRAMLDALDNDPRVAVAFDTCHAFASGYDERTAPDVKKTIDELDRVIGLDRVQVIHANDSVTGLGSNRDRHANIGDGQIGEEGFRALLHEPRLARLPFILEVPGAGGGPDKEQVATLRRLAGSEGRR
jgi:deoxyribonuclease IV